jgi:hypothetical protein
MERIRYTWNRSARFPETSIGNEFHERQDRILITYTPYLRFRG